MTFFSCTIFWSVVIQEFYFTLPTVNIFSFTNTCDCDRGYQELQAVSTAIQTVLSTPVSVATALKGIQKTLGKALPFKVWTASLSGLLADIYSSSLVLLLLLFVVFSILSKMVVQKIKKVLISVMSFLS